MHSNPQFTLITSTLNSGATLARCLCSVEAQIGAAFEHLIADGASQDDTLTIVENFAHRYPLRLACSRPDTGLYQAWNRAVKQACGQWILFLGSDDFLVSDDVLSRVAEAIAANPSLHTCSFLYGDTVTTQTSDWGSYHPAHWIDRLRGVTAFPNSVFINASLFREGHLFDESYKICADHKFFVQHHLFGHGAYLSFPIICFQEGGVSSNRDFQHFHYLERRRLLADLGRSRPWFTEWYYWLRSRQWRSHRPGEH